MRKSKAYHVQLLLLLAGSVCFSLLLAEMLMTLRSRLKESYGNKVLVKKYLSPYIFTVRPNTVKEERGITYTSNNFGMRRTTDVQEAVPKGVYRVLSYGDSIANGWGVQEEETYSHLLEGFLEREGRQQYQVLNMYRGVSPTVASFHIKKDAEQFKPMGVIMEIELLNDLSDEALVFFTKRDVNGLPSEIKRSRYIVGWDGHLLSSLTWRGSWVERTKVWTLASQYVGRLMNYSHGISAKSYWDPLFADESGDDYFFYHFGYDRHLLSRHSIERAFEQMFSSLQSISSYLDRRSIRFLLIILPSQTAYSDGRFRNSAVKLIAKAEKKAESMAIPYVSLFASLKKDGGESLFMDFCHPTGQGNRVIAESLLPILSDWQ